MFKTPLRKRIRASERFKSRYRSDPDFRLERVNKRRASEGKPLLASLPPVGEARKQWASGRQRNDKGRWV